MSGSKREIDGLIEDALERLKPKPPAKSWTEARAVGAEYLAGWFAGRG